MTENYSFRQLLDKSNAIHLTVNRYFISIYLVFHRLREGRIRVDNQCLFAQNENECVKVIKWAGDYRSWRKFYRFQYCIGHPVYRGM